MKKVTLLLILNIAKALGLFALARRVTAKDLRILCYHGAALRDENHFRPGLFMTEGTFVERMEYLAKHNYPVINLDEALDLLKRGALPNCAVVITIDDGWYGTYRIMVPVLHRHGFPATLYIASYYLKNQVQVFNVATSYVLWLSQDHVLDLSEVSSCLSGSLDLANDTQRDETNRILGEFAESIGGPNERQMLFREICEVLDVNWRAIEADRLISFMNEKESREILKMNIDIQLHTHRHRFRAEDFEEAKVEIEGNRSALAGISPGPLRHFCYPDGYYERRQRPWLECLGIVSATTVKKGFNRRDVSLYELRRFVDSERISSLEFEAEMSGFFELIRRCGYSI